MSESSTRTKRRTRMRNNTPFSFQTRKTCKHHHDQPLQLNHDPQHHNATRSARISARKRRPARRLDDCGSLVATRLLHLLVMMLVWDPLQCICYFAVGAFPLSQHAVTRRRRRYYDHRYDLPSFSSSSSRLVRITPATPSLPSSSSSSLHMVLTTPESIIEQASTQNLLDDLIDESVRTSARRTIMMHFDPSSGWIWRRWKGTVFSETWPSAVTKMAWGLVVYLCLGALKNGTSISGGMSSLMSASATSTATTTTIQSLEYYLSGFSVLWGQLLSVTTFTLTFFLNQSYALWRKCYELSRRLQGRLNDLGLTLAAHASRKTPVSSYSGEPSTYTSGSRQLLELISRYIRLFNLLTYASFTRSHRPILTPRGMRRLVERGLMTPMERQALVDAEVPATQRHNAVILWIVRAFLEGRQAGHIVGGSGFEQQFMEKTHVIRAQYGAIGDELQGRMPLAYAHIVQVLVDVVLWMYPIMSFSVGMSPFLGVLGTGLLTMFYQGLFDLAKQFLDPYDNENYGKGEDPLCVDTLIAETNSGSVRWMNSFEEQPFSSQRLRDGELFEYLLPLRGYSVEELAQMEEERLQKEREQQEKRDREEAERIQREREEEERRLEELEAIARNATLSNVTVADDESLMDAISKIQQSVNGTGADGDEKGRTVHKVYTLEDGTPVTLKPPEDIPEGLDLLNTTASKPVIRSVIESALRSDLFPLVDMAKPVNDDFDVPRNDTVTAALSEAEDPQESKDGAKEDEKKFEETRYNQYIYSLEDLDKFADFEWFDEIGEDGKEYRLSEQLAEEEWDEYIEEQEKQEELSFEDIQSRAKEIVETAASELRETAEILEASPGTETSVATKEKKAGSVEGPAIVRQDRKQQDGPAKYDQTRLDGISQLWGLPPEDPSALEGTPEPSSLSYEENQFDGISQLWAGEGTSASIAQMENVAPVLGGGSFAGISSLWGDSSLGGSSEGPSVKRRTQSVRSAALSFDDDGESTVPFEVDTSLYSDLLWHDEVGVDGKEYRLSEMLADEEWEALSEPVDDAPMSYADYTKQVEELREAVEEELLETEAILLAPPGADSWELSDEVSRLDDDHNNDERAVEPKDMNIEAGSLEVLEMDQKEDSKAVVDESALEEPLLPAKALSDQTDSVNGTPTGEMLNGDGSSIDSDSSSILPEETQSEQTP